MQAPTTIIQAVVQEVIDKGTVAVIILRVTTTVIHLQEEANKLCSISSNRTHSHLMQKKEQAIIHHRQRPFLLLKRGSVTIANIELQSMNASNSNALSVELIL